MDIIEAIYARMSVRAYKPDPVPRDLLAKVMEATIRAPSWSDTQSWEFAIIGGKVMEELKEAVTVKAQTGGAFQAEIPSPTFSDTLMDRSRKNGLLLFENLGIGRDDQQRRRDWQVQGIRFFDAPHGVIIYTDRGIGPYSIFDAGLAAQNLALAAVAYGLGTCLAIQAVYYPDVLRSILGIPESKLIVLGTPIGYPDWDHPANKHRSPREPLDNLITWHGL